MSPSHGPPERAVRLLEATLPTVDQDAILGDLHEVYLRRVGEVGRVRARWWYWSQALSFSASFTLERLWDDETGRWEMWSMVEGSARELALAVRNLWRTPAFTAVTVGTLALAIGANTAIFSVIDKVLLEPLPFPDADRIVVLRGTAPGSDLPEEFGLGTEFYVQYRENASTLADLALLSEGQGTVSYGDHVDRLFGAAASPSLYSVLGVQPLLGRLPTEEDPEGTVGVLSYRLWQDWFGGDPSALGKAVHALGTDVTIVGVMGPDFQFPEERTSLWVHDLPTPPIQPGGLGLTLVGRLAPDATRETLTRELSTLTQRLPERFGGPPQYAALIRQMRPVVRSMEEQLTGPIQTPLWILLGTVSIVLLIACANVANLLIVRAESRRMDLAVRRALGAGRATLIRWQMAEALALALLGGGLGLLLAWLGVPLLVRAAPEGIPRLSRVGLDGTAFLFTGGVVLLAATLAGLLPAVRFSNPSMVRGLRQTGRTGRGPDHLLRDGLVVVQTASALVLLVASGLLLQSFARLTRVDPGYDIEDVFTFQAAPDPGEHGLGDGPTFARFHADFMERLRALPGVESVGLANTIPLDEGAGAIQVAPEATAGEDVPQPRLRFTMVGGDYFETMGIDLLAGEFPEPKTEPDGQVDAVVSRLAGELLWPGENPVGRRLHTAADTAGAWVRIVGVVEDIYLEDFRQERPDPMLYLPMVGHTARSWAVGTPAYVVKTPRAESIAPEVRELVREIAPEAPMYRVFTMQGLAARSMARLSFTMLTLAVAAGLALVLGAVGLFGVLSYVVSQRTREIGIRMALGARAAELRRMVVLEGGRVTLVGVVLGLVGAVAATRVLASLLFGVGTLDLPTFAAMAGLMLLVAFLASYLPARRASAVDPIRSLRVE